MALSAGHPTLESDLKAAYEEARDDGTDGKDVIPNLSKKVGNAIHVYMETALVSTTIITPGTQTATWAGPTTAGTPGVYAPGTGTGTGNQDQGNGVSFAGGDVNTLINELKDAYIAARDSGTDGNDTTASLAADMKKAIHKFALTAEVDTDVTVNPGQVISGYMAIAGTTTVPVVAASLAGTGTGEGSLS